MPHLMTYHPALLSIIAQSVNHLPAVQETQIELGSVPGLGRSSGGGNGNPLQYAYLENPMDRGAWQITVHGVAGVEHDFATKTKLLSTIAPIE